MCILYLLGCSDVAGTCTAALGHAGGAMSVGMQLGVASLWQPGADGKLFEGPFRCHMPPVGCEVPHFQLRSLRANCRAGLRAGRTGGLKHLELSDRDPVK